jgi:hypothetical protein
MNGFQTEAIDRHVYFNCFSPQGFLQWPDVGYQIDMAYRSGYVTCSNLNDAPVIAFHQKTDEYGSLQSTVGYIIPEHWWPPFHFSSIANLSGWGELIWPKVAVCRQGYIHIVSCEQRDGGVWRRMAYARSEDGGLSYTTYTLVDTIISGVSQDIASSPVSHKVGIAYTRPIFGVTDIWPPSVDLRFLDFNNDVCLIESPDGVNWDFINRRNITGLIAPDTARWPDSTFADGDTLRAYCDVSLIYDQHDNAHLAFTTRGLWWDAARSVDPDSFLFAEMTKDASMIWHWSEQHDTLTRIADGWYDVGDTSVPDHAYRGTGEGRSTVDRPCLAQDPASGYLYCVYVRCAQGDTSGGQTPSHGWANGEIYCAVSTDGGLNWSQGTNLTNTPSPDCPPGNCLDEDYPSQALMVNDTLHIMYVQDRDAGGVVMTAPQEGIWTENEVIYQKVPADLIQPGPPYVSNFYFHVGPAGGVQVEEPLRTGDLIPEEYALHQNYPNPFNAVTEICYQIAQAGRITVKIFNPLGQEVRTLVDGRQEVGVHSVHWDGLNDAGQEAASGSYFCRMEGERYQQVIKLVLLR